MSDAIESEKPTDTAPDIVSLRWYRRLCEEVDHLVDSCDAESPYQMCVRFRDAIERAKSAATAEGAVVRKVVGLIVMEGNTASTYAQCAVSIPEQSLIVSG